MPAWIDDRWSYLSHRVVTLENEHIRADILPELGAKVFRLVHKKSGTDLLWHHPRIEPRAVPVGTGYDDHFSGGWDELFPNDAPGRVGDEVYPDHGELWCQPWSYRVEQNTRDEVTIHLRVAGASSPTVVEKWISLAAGEHSLRFRHRISNCGPKRLDFLWKLHPALVIDGGDRIDIPAKVGELVDPAFGRVSEPRTFDWPVATPAGGKAIDFSVLPPLDGARDFLYTRELSGGWCALRRMKLGLGFGLAFPKEVFSSVWLFMTYGGWRGLHTLVLEPCTTYPKDLAVAIRDRTCATLEAGASLDCEVQAVLFEGTDPVRGITSEGRVVR